MFDFPTDVLILDISSVLVNRIPTWLVCPFKPLDGLKVVVFVPVMQTIAVV